MAESVLDGRAAQNEHDTPDASERPRRQDDRAGENALKPPKKRRRMVKPNPDKKFECSHDGCGKSYSRAEHLYRHQLNHAPKTIYRCDYPGCARYFVRQDLCIRHRERHTTHGSQLQKRDVFARSTSHQHLPTDPPQHPGGQHAMYHVASVISQPLDQPHQAPSAPHGHASDPTGYGHPSQMSSSTVSPSTASTDPRYRPRTPRSMFTRPEVAPQFLTSMYSDPPSPISKQDSMPLPLNLRQTTFQDGTLDAAAATSADADPPGGVPVSGAYRSPVRQRSSFSAVHHQEPVRTGSGDLLRRSMTDDWTLSPEIPAGVVYSMSSYPPAIPSSAASAAAFAAAVSQGLTSRDPYPYPAMHTSASHMDVGEVYGHPALGPNEYNPTAYADTDGFTQWLFDAQSTATTLSPPNFAPVFTGHDPPHMTGSYISQSPTSSHGYSQHHVQHHLSVAGLVDPSASSRYIMSESKRQELLDLMQYQFIERPHDAVKKRKDSVFEGDIDSDGHILSLRMMHTYIGSYWYHQHAQLPILHKPTFSADRTPNLLLLAVIAIGAATLDKAYGTSLTDSAAEFANFVAWHIRWEIMRDADFRPPAKLWVFQALLLLEVYEKMYATRALHERAHIHHDSTLTLMRRGSSLLGRSASDSPPSFRGDQDDGKTYISLSGHETSKSEAAWHRWIATEATRRAVLAAFVIDSIHATMFGHAAKMVAHEMRSPLPCDEGLWSAVSAVEAGRVQSSLQTNGFKSTMFLDALKKTLNGQRVRTNSFGRTVIMAGLLSVSWNMAQRDLQISSLGPHTANSFGGPDKWKRVLLRAFDNWKRDFDEALAEAATTPSSPLQTSAMPLHSILRPVDDENIFESRTVLHHLAHIAAHVDVVDCQVFAGANRLLGRSITPKDFSVVREKIERWATKASARDAAFYALKFIAQVLIPPEEETTDFNSRFYGHASPILPQAFDHDQYIARDDFLLNRPWVLYISALVVWCYGFALEGPIKPPPSAADFASYQQKEQDMRSFLQRVGGIRAPDDLENVSGKNRCLGLLMILKESFESTRWELTHEAAGLLGNACLKLQGVEQEGLVDSGVCNPGRIDRATRGHSYVLSRHGSFVSRGEEITVASAAKV